MPPESGARSGKMGVDWPKYAEDARNLLLIASQAGPTAMRVWTSGWGEWATSVARTYDQLARGWTRIIQDPSRGGEVLDQMREDAKQYLVDIGGIPERAVLEFVQAMEGIAGSSGTGVGSADQAFVEAADNFTEAAAEALNRLETAIESRPAQRGRAAQAAGAPDPLVELRERVSRLNAARARLRKASDASAD